MSLVYRPTPEDIHRDVEDLNKASEKLKAKLNSKETKHEDVPKDISDLTNDERNQYILDYNNGVGN